nr:PREDICTED: U-box domain-containing protein 32-like [Daucus carota subsp. sativus]
MGSEGVIGIEGSCDVENTIFVAVGKNVKESKSTLLWALEYFAGRKLFDEKLSGSKLRQKASRAFRELERQKMHKLLNRYLRVLDKVEAGKIWIEMERVDEGIVHIIAQKHIRWLVMGAATDKQYSKNLSELKSKKAIYVLEKAPAYCKIWFPCKGFLICSRGALLEQDDIVDAYEYDNESESLEHLNNTKVIDTPNNSKVIEAPTSIDLMMVESKEDSSTLALSNEPPECLVRSSSTNWLEERPQGQGTSDLYHKIEHATILAEKSKQAAFKESIKRWNAEEDAREALHKDLILEPFVTWMEKYRKFKPNFILKLMYKIARMLCVRDKTNRAVLLFLPHLLFLYFISLNFSSLSLPNSRALASTLLFLSFPLLFSLPSFLLIGAARTCLLSHSPTTAAAIFRLVLPRFQSGRLPFRFRRVYSTSTCCSNYSRAETLKSICMEETSQRKELEDMLAKQRQEIESMKNQHLQCIEELKVIREQTPVLESRITETHHLEKELEEKIIQAVELLVKFKEQRDELQTECETATEEVKKLQKMSEKETMGSSCSQFFVLPFLEISEATQNFDPSLKIREGKSGCVYKGHLRHVKVAIKMLPSHGSQSDLEFENEAVVLSRVRHPNLVQLVGICPESRSLVYEYCENGNLEDRLVGEGKTPSLPWQSRVRIAIDVCSALAFLHSSNPCIVHGNIKLTSILLDSNYVGKLSNTGLFRFVSNEGRNPTTSNDMSSEASVYVDPEFFETGQLTTESDVYSFGIVLLQLLTGRKQASGVVKDVKCALENGNFETVLDFSAGDFPLELAKQAALLALRCCETERANRPNIVSDIWRLVLPMRNLCPPASLGTEEKRRIPSHFVCPIFQDVMKDPCIAADGFTYEADAIKGWLNSGHKTSPMTNLQLDHCDLLPNSALYYAIQEWEQQP